MKTVLVALQLVLALCWSSASAQGAAQWPDRPVRLVVGFGPGGGNDVTARLLAAELSTILGQQVVVENRTGAGGIIGTEAVAKANADGYTLMLGTSSQLVMNVALYKKLAFSITNDLEPVALLSRTPMTMLVSPTVSARSFAEFVTETKNKPGAMNYAGLGPGSVTHVAMEMFLKAAGLNMTAVHYRAQPAAFQALLVGEVHAILDATPSYAAELVAAGKARSIALTFKPEGYSLPVPSFRQAGFASAESYTWNSIMAPRGTPTAVVDKINAAVNTALRGPKMKTFFEKNGIESLAGSSPGSTGAFWKAETTRWVPLIQSLGIALD
jgi:tripartite-type tricarboxylate transporter receptor subunit TctC